MCSLTTEGIIIGSHANQVTYHCQLQLHDTPATQYQGRYATVADNGKSLRAYLLICIFLHGGSFWSSNTFSKENV